MEFNQVVSMWWFEKNSRKKRKEKKNKKEKKEKCQKEENKKGFHQIL